MSDTRESNRISARFASLVVKHPWRVLLAGLLLFGALFPGADKVKEEVSYRIWFRADDPNLKQYDELLTRFSNDNALVVVAHSPSGVFDKDSAELLVELTDKMWQIPQVIRVESLSNFRWVRANEDDVIVSPLIPNDEELTEPLLQERKKVALEHEVLPGYLVSEDGRTAIVYAWLAPFVTGEEEHEAVGATEALLEELGKRGDHKFFLTGEPAQQVAFEKINAADFETLIPGVMLFMLVVLIGVFRKPSGVLLPIATIIIAVMGGLAMAGWLGLGLNSVTFLMPMIVIAVTASNLIHVMVGYYSALRKSNDRREAVRSAVHKTFLTTFFASTTTAVGFVSLVTAEIVPIRNLGILTSVGIVLGWIFIQLILVPLLVLLPIRFRKKKGTKQETDGTEKPTPKWAVRLYEKINAKRWVIIGAGLVIAISAAFLGSRNEVRFDPLTFFPEDYGVRKAHDFVEREVGWVSTVEIIIDTGKAEGIKDPDFLNKVDEFQQWLEAQDYTSQTASLVDILKATNRALNGGKQEAYRLTDTRQGIAERILLYSMNLPPGLDLNDRMTLENDALRVTVWWSIRDSNSALDASSAIEKKGKELGLDVEVTGRSYLFYELDPYAVSTLLRSLGGALILVTILLMVFFRSFKLGLLALVPNLLPLTLGAGFLYIIGLPMDFANAVVFSVALGIAVDDTVHFMAAYYVRNKQGLSVAQSLTEALADAGKPMVITTMILMATFSLLSFASFTPLRSFGLLISVVLLAALITDLILLPALLRVMSRDDNKSAR